MDVAAYAVMALSALGFALSLASHVCALAGLAGPLGDSTFGLHIGIFVVWFPAVLFARALVKNVPRDDFWKATLRGCPPWMRYAFYGIFGYALLNFLFMMTQGKTVQKSGGPMTPAVVRGFSGHWMLFYWGAFVIAYSYAQVGTQPQPRCANGHEVSPVAKFCEQCGAPVDGTLRFGGSSGR